LGCDGGATTKGGSMNQNITVEIRDVYGVAKVYPMCSTAQLFADIAGTKTLLPEDIKRIQMLGYSVEVKQREIKL
jgi:hypothetical protein